MSLLPGLTQSAPGVPIFAPASGGGGGGSTQFSSLTVSSLTVSLSGLINDGSFNFTPTNFGTVGAPVFGHVIQSSDGNSLYMTSCANSSGLMNDYKGVSSSTGTFGLRTIVDSANAYVGYPSNPFGNDGGQTVYALSTLSHAAPSTISMASPAINFSTSALTLNGAPIGGGGAAISTFPNITVSSGTIAANGTLNINAVDPNLYQFTVSDNNASTVTSVSLGTIGGRNQLYATIAEAPAFFTSTITGTTGVIQLNPTGTEQIRIGGLGAPGDITLNTVGGGQIVLNGAASAPITASISSLTVSSINGAIPGGNANLTNIVAPWITGFPLSGQQFINVDSNTQGAPVPLINPVPANPANVYMVSYCCSSGSNADASQPTAVSLLCPPAAPVYIRTYQGGGSDYFTTGQAGVETAIVRGASSLQVVAGCASATASTLIIFDATQAVAITNLGTAS